MTVRVHASTDGLWCILLAAGGSRRLGHPKQLLRNPVRPLILDAVDAAQTITPGRVLVVLGAYALRLQALLARNSDNLSITKNTHWKLGIAGSLIVGLDALPVDAKAAMILLTDQPAVSPASLRRLTDAWQRQPKRAVASGYAGGFGVPAILPRRLWPRLRQLDGDTGARAVLREAIAETLVVDIPEAEFDIDTEQDWQRLKRRIS